MISRRSGIPASALSRLEDMDVRKSAYMDVLAAVLRVDAAIPDRYNLW
ncbi:MAG: hypothetical protein HOC70_07430 [Gammaproteobacteria bacterium]|nr:hypothetical protein [Gammaproteobacteria bacterium]MBT4493060.1 hypothetical protein [Gammaproteobacteria bacterium]MBT7371682.1 hypothetical protein [Gammaproteobacteria bacterium]